MIDRATIAADLSHRKAQAFAAQRGRGHLPPHFHTDVNITRPRRAQQSARAGYIRAILALAAFFALILLAINLGK